MRKLLATVLLLGFTVVSYGEGAISFENSVLSRYSIPGLTDLTTIPLHFGVFWGPSANEISTSPVLPLGVSSLTISGVFTHPRLNNNGTYPIPGTEPLQTVFMRIRGWDAAFGTDWIGARDGGALFAETDVRQVRLLHDIGPAQVIWQNTSGTSPERFYPLVFIPEPSGIALGVLTGIMFLMFRRMRE